MADVDGDGKDDLVRHRAGHERFGPQDVYVHFDDVGHIRDYSLSRSLWGFMR